MDISKLTSEEREQLLSQLKADKQAEAQRVEEERETYKRLKDEAVKEAFAQLSELSTAMTLLKKQIFERFNTIIDLKDDLYKTKSNRQSDTFTTEDSSVSIKLGNRINEGWDDTVEIGVQKVKDFLKTLAKDEESGALVETVMRLLSKDRKGNLKASKVLELEQMATKSKNEAFIEGIQIIKDAYRPVPSVQFIEVRYKDENGKEISLPLSMAAIQ